MTAPAPTALVCRDLALAYDGDPVVEGFSLTVAAGESVALLGPSGSGKSTVLSAIAGFIEPASGEILLRDRLVAGRERHVPPEQRNVGMVFQHYALWPHISALDTVAYPMRRRGVSTGRAREEAAALLDRLGLAGLADRRPAQLSGGEQQRIGLARAMAREPDIYLFDEPTAHLDTPLRAALQEELAVRRAGTGAAAVTATHDVGEALAVADRVILLRAGRAVQVGTPQDVYERPVDLWAARLTGPASLIEATVIEHDADARGARLRIGQREVRVPAVPELPAVGPVKLLLRPDWVSLDGELSGTLRGAWYRGPHTDYRIETEGGEIDLRESGPPRVTIGSPVGWRIERAWALPPSPR